MPLLMSSNEKIEAARAKLRSSNGAFDHKIKANTRNQMNNSDYNRFWEVKLERQLPVMGSTLFAGRRQGNGTYSTYEGKSSTSAVGEMFAGFEIPLLRDRAMDETRLQRVGAEIDFKNSQIEWEQKAVEIYIKSSEVYWKWVASGQKLKVLKSWVENAISRQSWLEKKWKHGDISEIKLTDNRRSLAKREAELVKVQREFSLAQAELALYIQETNLSIEQVPAEIRKVSTPTSDVEISNRNKLPAFRLIQNESDLLYQEKDFANALALPELKVGVEGAKDLNGPAPGRDSNDQLRVALKVEIPLENRKGGGKREEVSHKLASLRYRKTWLEREWQTRIEQNRIASQKIKEQLNWQTQEQEDTTKMAQAEIKKLASGASDVFFVNIREQDEAEVKMRVIETQMISVLIDIERKSLDGTLIDLIHKIKE
ncbi:MAG: TolC family protein [Bacteriovoracaceae bacterium]|nr:TolC family protein [Bacteriovoracaceae bacterium]